MASSPRKRRIRSPPADSGKPSPVEDQRPIRLQDRTVDKAGGGHALDDTSREAIAGAAEALSRGDAAPALELCDPEVVLRVAETPNHPAGKAFFGRTALEDQWQNVLLVYGAPPAVTPVDVMTGDGYLALVVEVMGQLAGKPVSHRLIVTGVAGASGLWRELWLQPAD